MSSDSKTIAQAAGNIVSRYVDAPEFWLWERFVGDEKVEGSSPSFISEDAAWQDAAFETSGFVMGVNNLSSETWDAMSIEAKLIAIQSVFSDVTPVVTP